ncbi:50S ribosomal protein L34e [Candidatus Woesearchaeota archaeon]|nr:50S ribosomal protein L34e [Candidatus Woesearchaeota archaeon]
MVRRALRSRSFRKVKVKTPGRRILTHYRKKKPRPARCASCRAVLKGIPRERPKKMMNMPKTGKRPERPYAGVLCSKCTRTLMKQKVKSLE